MKKFYSIIAIASLMLTSVVSFTSCQKDEMPMPAKTQTVNTTNNSNATQPGTTTATTTTNGTTITTTTKTTDTQVNQLTTFVEESKVKDTNYAVGTWKATVNGTDYTLEISSNSVKGTADISYTTTFYAGDKTYKGKFYASLYTYAGEFDSEERAVSGKIRAWLIDAVFNESNFSEFTADAIEIEGTAVAEHVKFVKQ